MPTTELITTPFGFESTAAEVAQGVSLSGTRGVVTGAASGIGVETARALAGAGADVTLAVRDPEAGGRVAADITATTGNAVHVGRLDLSDQGSVAGFVANWSGPLHILINNAGVIFARSPADRRGLGDDVRDQPPRPLRARARPARLTRRCRRRADRVAQLRRAPELAGDIRRRQLHLPDDPGLAYGQSKTANVLFAVEEHAAGLTTASPPTRSNRGQSQPPT